MNLKDSRGEETRSMPTSGFGSNSTETKRDIIKNCFVMINQEGTTKVHNIMAMHACSTTQKVLKCQHDSDSDESCLIDVSSSLASWNGPWGTTGDIPYGPYPSDEFTLYTQWMTNSCVMVEEEESVTVKKVIAHWLQEGIKRRGLRRSHLHI